MQKQGWGGALLVLALSLCDTGDDEHLTPKGCEDEDTARESDA